MSTTRNKPHAYLPVDTRHVGQVQAYIEQLEAAAELDSSLVDPDDRNTTADSPRVDDEGPPTWPDQLLRRASESQVKSVEIMSLLLDEMASEPGTEFAPNRLADIAERSPKKLSRTTTFNALGKLGPHFKKHYGRGDLPFVREGEPGTFRYRMTPEQAAAWRRVRGAR